MEREERERERDDLMALSKQQLLNYAKLIS